MRHSYRRFLVAVLFVSVLFASIVLNYYLFQQG